MTGQTKLDPSQLVALRSNKLYIQIDSEKVPSGHLWGWLLEEHEIVGQDVPQKGPWFLPPFAVKTKYRREDPLSARPYEPLRVPIALSLTVSGIQHLSGWRRFFSGI